MDITRKSSLHSLEELGACLCRRYESAAEGGISDRTVVFVLGAEASRASCLKAWSDFGSDLVDDLSGRFQSDEEDAFLDDALTRLQPIIGPAPKGFGAKKKFLKKKASPEQILEVACQNTIFEKIVRKKLKEEYGPQKAPQLGYELVAHLLRHSFIDHVISFNWDEILDRAINGEIGASGYRRVLPEAHSSSASIAPPGPRLFNLN